MACQMTATDECFPDFCICDSQCEFYILHHDPASAHARVPLGRCSDDAGVSYFLLGSGEKILTLATE